MRKGELLQRCEIDVADGMKWCSKCHKVKPVVEFYVRDDDYITKICNTCISNHQRDLKTLYPTRYWAMYTIQDHKKRGCLITLSRIELETLANNSQYCNICNCELKWGTNKKSTHDSPTLDRLVKEFIKYCKHVANKYGDDI